jgi:trans-aconitate methyltransferase
MTPYSTIDADAWQESWDRQQEGYLPDREHRFATMLDAVDAIADTDRPRLLDLAGGTGTITLRALTRFPHAEVTMVDLDPVLLAIATASLTGRASIITADLAKASWRALLPHQEYDAALTATALHWLPADRLTALYAEIHGLLRPGGILVNADHMPDDGLPGLTKRLSSRASSHRNGRHAAGATLSWQEWWDRVAADPSLAPLAAQRASTYPTGHAAEWNPPVSWHLDALRSAGYAEVGILWRGKADAAVAAVR